MSVVTKQFVLAGKASFVTGNTAGDAITISIKKAVKEKINPRTGQPFPMNYWVSVRDKNESWAYLGVLNTEDFAVRLTAKSAMGPNDLPVKVTQWVLGLIFRGESVPEGYRLEHTGRCCMCGKMLRDAASIARGIGPECIKKPYWTGVI